MRKEFIRYVTKDSKPYVEKALYIQAGTEGTDINDPRAHSVQGETGTWIVFIISLITGQDTYDVSKDFHTQLDPSLTEIDEATYNTMIAAENTLAEQAQADRIAAIQAAEAQKRSDLITKFNAGVLFGGDAEAFELTYGFSPV